MSKKPEPKKQESKQEPPAEQQQEQEVTMIEDEPPRPMAVQPPTIEERVEAIEIRLKLAEEFCTKHNRYHFGREVSKG